MLKVGNYYKHKVWELEQLVMLTGKSLRLFNDRKSRWYYYGITKSGEWVGGYQSDFRKYDLKTCQLKFGDECQVTGNGSEHHYLMIGQRAVVKQVHDDDFVLCRSYNGANQLVHRSHLKLLPNFTM